MNILRPKRLGVASQPSPLISHWEASEQAAPFVSDETVVPVSIEDCAAGRPTQYFEIAGARRTLYFDPARTVAGIVTCGGLCPGLNNVVRSLVLTLHHMYGVEKIFGFRYGYHGLNPANGHPPIELTPELVSDIHETGGTILGTSRGPEERSVMVEYLRSLRVNILFTIGGDGTQQGSLRLCEEAQSQGYELCVVGIPKTIDNDILYVSRTFGFNSAVDCARGVIDSAHTEARAVLNGVGLVRLMGRDSGFIAAGATLASGEVNYCLIPEQPFELSGPRGLLALLEKRLALKRHAVIVVAEGAGQDLVPGSGGDRDASGNVRHADIGVFLRQQINSHFSAKRIPVNIRYIDPSYMIRGIRANTEDAVLCDLLARNAAHAAMAGINGALIGLMHDQFVHVPIQLIAQGRKQVQLQGTLWKAVLATTGQPVTFLNTF